MVLGGGGRGGAGYPLEGMIEHVNTTFTYERYLNTDRETGYKSSEMAGPVTEIDGFG